MTVLNTVVPVCGVGRVTVCFTFSCIVVKEVLGCVMADVVETGGVDKRGGGEGGGRTEAEAAAWRAAEVMLFPSLPPVGPEGEGGFDARRDGSGQRPDPQLHWIRENVVRPPFLCFWCVNEC